MAFALLDSHLHLQDDAFSEDRPQVIERAAREGVALFLCNGSTPEDWPQVCALASADSRIIPFLGLHPWYVGRQGQRDWLIALRTALEAVPSGVGEIGLDRWIKDPDVDAQLEAFRAQVQLACDLNRPATIHCLRAWGLLMDELRSAKALPGGFIVHAFGGPADLVGPLADLGAYFSFAGNVLDPKGGRRREALLRVPADRLLIETDAPDIPPPAEHRVPGPTLPDGRYRNEPVNLPAILEGVAALRNEPAGPLAEQIWENGHRLLKGLV
jgi:TatD DNase family protein